MEYYLYTFCNLSLAISYATTGTWIPQAHAKLKLETAVTSLKSLVMPFLPFSIHLIRSRAFLHTDRLAAIGK